MIIKLESTWETKATTTVDSWKHFQLSARQKFIQFQTNQYEQSAWHQWHAKTRKLSQWEMIRDVSVFLVTNNANAVLYLERKKFRQNQQKIFLTKTTEFCRNTFHISVLGHSLITWSIFIQFWPFATLYQDPWLFNNPLPIFSNFLQQNFSCDFFRGHPKIR